MDNADRWVQPTKYSGEWPDGFAGYTWLQWVSTQKVYHPGDDYNFGVAGWDDFGQDVVCVAKGVVIFNGALGGYGNCIIVKHTLGYNLKRFIKEKYGIDTNELYSQYGHLKDALAPVGMKLDVGQLLGHVGDTGNSTAPHLHLEIYAPIGELIGKPWDFYPIGWSKEQVQKYWLPVYLFIEATKSMPDYDTFLGKSRSYWEQVEQDRANLLKQLGEVESKWAVRVSDLEKQVSTLTTDNANLNIAAEQTDAKLQSQAQDFQQKLDKKDQTILEANQRIEGILKEQAASYKFLDAFKLVIRTIFRWGGESETNE